MREGDYAPPPDCDFNRVMINLTVTSQGRQYDRLGIMYLGDVEVFRTSTAEPTSAGIIWTYVKEMQQYNALWREKQRIIFDLGNLVDEICTGIYHVKLEATFFTVPGSPKTADIVLPVSRRLSARDEPSAFTIPDQIASVAYTIPPNVDRAIFTIAACGQADEEFWYQSLLESTKATFSDTVGSAFGGGSWREIQLLIDGQLAGVSWPFPIIFTGGINPGLWRPIVGINTFDLVEEEIDISPWLPFLVKGTHAFEIRVVDLIDNGHGGTSVRNLSQSNWVVSGKLFLFNGTQVIKAGAPPTVVEGGANARVTWSLTQDSEGTNVTLTEKITVERSISIFTNLNTKNGSHPATWSQTLSFDNMNYLTDYGFTQRTVQCMSLQSSSSSGFGLAATYPIDVTESSSPADAENFTIEANLTRGLQRAVSGPSVFPNGIQPMQASSGRFKGSAIDTTQKGRATYLSGDYKKVATSEGTTEQAFSFRGLLSGSLGEDVELYSRHVRAENASVVEDQESQPND